MCGPASVDYFLLWTHNKVMETDQGQGQLTTHQFYISSIIKP